MATKRNVVQVTISKVYQLSPNKVLVQMSNGINYEYPIENPMQPMLAPTNFQRQENQQKSKEWTLPWEDEKIQIPLVKCQGKAMYLKADGKSYFPVGIYQIHATNNGKEVYQLLYADLKTGMAFHQNGGFPGKVEKCAAIEWHNVDFDEFGEAA